MMARHDLVDMEIVALTPAASRSARMPMGAGDAVI
jgi:hypothetical protein